MLMTGRPSIVEQIFYFFCKLAKMNKLILILIFCKKKGYLDFFGEYINIWPAAGAV